MDLPVYHRRSDYRDQLASFVSGPAPFLSLYLDVTEGQARDTVRTRLLEALDGQNHRGDHVLSPAQWSAAGDALGLIEDRDGTLVAFIDQDGLAMVTGYPTPPSDELVVVSDPAVLIPLLRAEQGLIHHVIAVLEGESLTLLVAPRHGAATHEVINVTDRREAAMLVHRAAHLSETGLVILCAANEELGSLGHEVRVGLPLEVTISTVGFDDLDADVLAKEIRQRVAARAMVKTDEVLAMWRFHQANELVVEGIAETMTAVADGRAALVVVADQPVDPAGPPARGSEAVVAAALRGGLPVHVLPATGDGPSDGVGAVLAGRVDPTELARLIEH